MKLVIKPLKTTPASAPEEQRDASRSVRGPGGIYEGVISTYREEPSQPTRQDVPRQPEPAVVRHEATSSWENPYSMAVEPVATSWKEKFVQTTFRDAPEWIRNLILHSCLKSNLFRDEATSPKLERIAKMFGDADLRILYRDQEQISSLKFPSALSTLPSFEESVYEDETDFVDCVLKRILDTAMKRYRYAKNEMRNIQCKQLQSLKCEDISRVVKTIHNKPSAVGLRGEKILHLLYLSDLEIGDVFQLKERLQRFENRLADLVKVGDFEKTLDVTPWQLQALKEMEKANLETIQLERCRWTTRLEDETRALRSEYELWVIKSELDDTVRCLSDFEVGWADDSAPITPTDMQPYLAAENGHPSEFLAFQRALLSRLVSKFEQDHELSSHAEGPVYLLRGLLNPGMETDEVPDEAAMRGAAAKCVGVLREVMCNAIGNMFVDDSGDDDSMEFMERIEFLQDGIRDLGLLLAVQDFRRQVLDMSGKRGIEEILRSPVTRHLNQAVLRIVRLADVEAREMGGAPPPPMATELKFLRESIQASDLQCGAGLLVSSLQRLQEGLSANGEHSWPRTRSMVRAASKMLLREQSAELLEGCRRCLREERVSGRDSGMVDHLGTLLVETLVELEEYFPQTDVRPQDAAMDHVAFWRICLQLVVEGNFSLRMAARAACQYARCLGLQRRFVSYRRLEHGRDNHLRKLQDEMRSILSSIDLASTRRADHSAQEIRARLAVLQLQVKQLLITQPKLQGLDLVSEPKSISEFARDVLSRKSWIARFHDGLVACLLSDSGPLGHRLGESLLLTELISNIWVDCFKQVGKKDEIERGGWMAVSSVEASHGGIRIDPTICSQLLSASEFKNVSFSHALVGRTNQFKSSMEVFRILLGYLIMRGLVYPSCAQVRKFLDWAVEQSLDCSTREIPLLLPRPNAMADGDEELVKSRLPHVVEDFPFPHLLLRMMGDLEFVGNYRFPDLSETVGSQPRLRFAVRVLTQADEADLRRSSQRAIFCASYRQELAGTDPELLDLEWTRREAQVVDGAAVVEQAATGSLLQWVSATKSVAAAVRAAGIFSRIALLDAAAAASVKDLEEALPSSAPDRQGNLALARLTRQVLIYKEAPVIKVVRLRIPVGGCRVWPAQVDGDRTVFPPAEDFEGRRFDERFERHGKPLGDPDDGVSLIKWRGASGSEERWYLLRRLAASARNRFAYTSPALVRHHLRSVWVASEAARVLLFTESRSSKDAPPAVALLPCRLYEFRVAFDEDDYGGDESWEDSLLLFALEAGDVRVPPDLDALRGRARAEEDELKVPCEDVCRLAVADALLGTRVVRTEEMQAVADAAGSRQFVFRMPTGWDTALGSGVLEAVHGGGEGAARAFQDPGSAALILEQICTGNGNHLCRQRPGWFDQGDRGRLALVKFVREMCGEVVRQEFDSTRSKKLAKVLSYARHLDASCRDPLVRRVRGGASYEECLRARARVLASLAHKLERRDADSDLALLTETASAVAREEQAPRVALLFADPLPASAQERSQVMYDFEHGETGVCSNVVEGLALEALAGVNAHQLQATTDAVRSAFLNFPLVHLAAKAYLDEGGLLYLLLERPQREGIERISLGSERVCLDPDLLRRAAADAVAPRFVVLQAFMSPQRFCAADVRRALEQSFGEDGGLCVLVVDGDSVECGGFLRGLYEALRRGSSFEDAVRAAGDTMPLADFAAPWPVTSFAPFASAAKQAPWRAGAKAGGWKAAAAEDRSRPLQTDRPSALARAEWLGGNISFARNEELLRMAQALETSPRFVVVASLFEDACAGAYEFFRFCGQRLWRSKAMLTRIDGFQGEGMLKRDVVRYLCRDLEDEPWLGDEAKRSGGGGGGAAARRATEEAAAVGQEEDPEDELSVLVRQSGVDLFVVIDGTATHGQRHSRLAEYLGLVGDHPGRISFGDRQKVVYFTCRPLRGFQGPEIRLGPVSMATSAGREFFGRCWQRFREEDAELRRKRPAERAADAEAAMTMFCTVSGLSTELERFVVRFLARLAPREVCRFSVWMQERGEGLSPEGVIGFCVDTLRPEEQGALAALSLLEGRFDALMLPRLLGKWEECAELGYRFMLLRCGLPLEDDQDLRKKVQWAVAVSRSLVDGVNQDSKRSTTAAAPLHRQFLFPEVALEKFVAAGLVTRLGGGGGGGVRRGEERAQYALPDHVREWARGRIGELARACPHSVEAFQAPRRGALADFVSDRLMEAGAQSPAALNAAWEAHQRDWLRAVGAVKDSDDALAVCRLSRLVWSVVLGNSWNMVFSRYPKATVRAWADKAAVLREDLVETSSVIAFARLEFVRAGCDLEHKDKETYEPALKVLESSLDAMEQNWSALAPFSVDFNNNAVDYYLCRAEMLNLQGQIRSWIRKDPKEKDALKLYEEAMASCFGGRPITEEDNILHRVLLAKIQANVGHSLRSVGHRELKHYQKKDAGKRKRGALEEIIGYFRHAEDSFQRCKELYLRQGVFNRGQLFSEKHHDVQLARAFHGLALCKLGLAKALRQAEGEAGGDEEMRGGGAQTSAEVLREARDDADRALAARAKWGARGNLSLLVEAVNARVLLCTVLYEMRPEDREADWREVVSRERRVLLDDVALLRERKRADLLTHVQRSALRGARKEVDKALAQLRELFEEEEGVQAADSGGEP